MNIEAFTRTFLSVAFILSLTACAGFSERLSNVGKDPKVSAVENPVQRAGYQPVSMPMPAIQPEVKQVNSLWTSGRKGFFKDQRASAVGDILTVLVDIEDEATLENKTTKARAATEQMGLPNLLGFENSIGRVLPDEYNPATAIGTESSTNNTGNGKIEREEEVDLKVAAVITQVLPNGNLVIHGKQQVRVNNERRDLEVAGVIRPEDIDVANSITYEKIAEARIIYGGQGMLTDVNRPRYGNEVMDVLLPF